MPDKSLFDNFLEDEGPQLKQNLDKIVEPLSSEISLIQDEGMREIVTFLLAHADHFWTSYVSDKPDVSPIDEYKPGGLVEHIKRVTRAAFFIASSKPMDEDDILVLLSAALLHAVIYPIAPNDKENEMPLFNPYYTYDIDRYFEEVIDQGVRQGVFLRRTLADDERYNMLMERTLRTIHCCEGSFSPIAEFYPQNDVELMMASAKIVARSLHIIVDGIDIKEERWYTND